MITSQGISFNKGHGKTVEYIVIVGPRLRLSLEYFNQDDDVAPPDYGEMQ